MTIATFRYSLSQQLAEVDREIAMRERVYPGLVVRHKLRQTEADYQLGAMKAVAKTLRWLQEHEARIKETVGE